MTASEFFLDSMYFKPKELGGSDNFSSPDQPGSYTQINATLLQMLENARYLAGVPFLITSGYRSDNHNKKVGGAEHSSHLTGRAVDISCRTSYMRLKIMWALKDAGFNRIGVYRSWIHADIDDQYGKIESMWLQV